MNNCIIEPGDLYKYEHIETENVFYLIIALKNPWIYYVTIPYVNGNPVCIRLLMALKHHDDDTFQKNCSNYFNDTYFFTKVKNGGKQT